MMQGSEGSVGQQHSAPNRVYLSPGTVHYGLLSILCHLQICQMQNAITRLSSHLVGVTDIS